jgi:hypothetical protein
LNYWKCQKPAPPSLNKVISKEQGQAGMYDWCTHEYRTKSWREQVAFIEKDKGERVQVLLTSTTSRPCFFMLPLERKLVYQVATTTRDENR